MNIPFPWPALFAMAVALAAMTLLAYRNHCWAEQFRKDRDLATQECRHKYAEGHADGLKLGLARGLGEGEQSAAKHFQAGYDQALADLAAQMREAEREVAQGLTVDLRRAGAN